MLPLFLYFFDPRLVISRDQIEDFVLVVTMVRGLVALTFEV